MFRRLLLLVLVALFALVFGFVTFTPSQAVTMVRAGGYWVILAGFMAFMYFLLRSLRSEWSQMKKIGDWWRAGLLIIGASGFLHLHEPHQFKIVADEVVLSSTAMQMHFARESGVVLRGYEFAGNFLPMQVYLDKRPLFFPFLLSLVHDLTGYRVANVFALNALVTLTLVAGCYLVGRRMGGAWAGAAAVLLLCAIPLVGQNATGGGFELLNIAMIVVTVWLGLRYAERADSDRLCAFVLAGVLLAQTRYESVLFLAPVAASILYIWLREKRVDLPWALIFSPLLLLVYPLQHNVFKMSESTWQLNDVAGATSPFALRYFYDNVGHALNFFFSFNGTQPSSWLVAVLGMVATAFFALVLYKKHREFFARDRGMAVASIFIIALVLHTGLMLCYFWGKWDDPIIRRLSLPVHVLFILAILFVGPHLVSHARRWHALTWMAAIYVLGFTVPASAMHRFTQDNFAARTTNWLGGYIRTLGDKNVLAIDNNAGLQWFLYRKSSINPLLFASRIDEYAFHYESHSFEDYLVVQRAGVDLKTGDRFVSVEDDLGPGVKLQLIEEKAFSPIYLVRLSRVVGLDKEKLKLWAEERKKLKKASASGASMIVVSVDDPDQLVIWLRKLP